MAASDSAPTAPEADAPRRRSLVARARAQPRWALAITGGAFAAIAFALSLTTSETEFQTTLKAPGGSASAQVDVYGTTIGRLVRLETSDLPILPKRSYYELWFVGPGDSQARPNRISAGTFHPDDNGHSKVQFAAAVDPRFHPVLSVTAEPGDGDPRAAGPEVLRSPGG